MSPKLRNTLFIFLSAFLFTACHVDFSPNAPWQEIPVVYCLLDQDEDTTWVRVQKCYLGEGNLYGYASQYDSVNYPSGTLSVTMEMWRAKRGRYNTLEVDPAANAPVRTFTFVETMLNDKPQGNFASPAQMAFCCPTAGLLDTGCVYRLLVRRASGDTLATAVTSLVGGTMELRDPTSRKMFQFSGAGEKKCVIQWTTLPRARQYQPQVTFFYNDFVRTWNGTTYDTLITPHSIDIECPVRKSGMNTLTEQVDLYQSSFLSTIQLAIGADTTHKVVVDSVLIAISACNEDFAAYLFSVESTGSVGESRSAFSNIDGGLGVFAARRTHLSFFVPTPPNSDSQYKKKLKELNLGV